MIPIRIAEPNVLIVSGRNKRISRNVGIHYTNLGGIVMIVDINLQENRLVIENLNENGVKYASITREVSDENEAREVLHNYLDDCNKFSVVINLAGEESAAASRLIDILDPEGGVLYTDVMGCGNKC
ncbi:hypothetical protein ASZ90_019386 [hydrocarbon metagenome]|uniref:Uncharacterized protein n=1 Tax=hydrocarbon metagenome TaxID=938273 RepID=A0A0W8E3P2_9ZZZZ